MAPIPTFGEDNFGTVNTPEYVPYPAYYEINSGNLFARVKLRRAVDFKLSGLPHGLHIQQQQPVASLDHAILP